MDDGLMNRTTYAGRSRGPNRAPTAYEQQSSWGFHQCCVVRSKDETRDALPVPRKGKRRNGAGFLLGRRPKKELASPKANVKLGPFTSSRRGPKLRARPARTVRGIARGLTPMLRSLYGKPRPIGAQRHASRMAMAKCGDFSTITDDGNSLSPVI